MDGKLRNMTAVYLRCGGGMLLLYRIGSRVIGNSYTGTAGGHFEKDELNDAKACVLRELYEETGLREQDIENLALRYVTLRLKNGEIRQNYYFFGDLCREVVEKWGLPGSEMSEVASKQCSQGKRCKGKLPESSEGKLEWVPNEKIMELDMPASAKYMMQHYLEIGKDTNALYGGITTSEGATFTELEEF